MGVQTGVGAPLLRVSGGERPTLPRSRDEARLRLALVLASSLLGHAALLAFLPVEPEMTASIGEDAITVEIVVGAESAAGTADMRSDVEAEQQPAIEARQEESVREKSVKEESTPPEPAMTPAEEPIAPVRTNVTPPDRSVEPTPEPKPPEPSPPSPPPSTASAAANSIGHGRMVAGDANYRGLVAARLARFKRFPADARRRREQGSALISFIIDGAGLVTSVRLVRGTGFVALDDEVQAMVRRASPFPPPPSRGETIFTAPVSFHLQ